MFEAFLLIGVAPVVVTAVGGVLGLGAVECVEHFSKDDKSES